MSLVVFGFYNWAVTRFLNGEGNGTPLQFSGLENPMGRGAWHAAVHGVTKSQTQLSNFTFTFNFHALEKEMAAHASVLTWRIPETAEPGGLPSTGLHRVRHDWCNLAVTAAAAGFLNETAFNRLALVRVKWRNHECRLLFKDIWC